MEAILIAVVPIFALSMSMLAVCEVGRRIGRRSIRQSGALAKGSGAAEAAVFGLLGLLLAFTFSGAASRFEQRRHLIVEEANAIGTAYLRMDGMPVDAQPALRALFREYAQVRYSVYRNVRDEEETSLLVSRTAALQDQIWRQVVALCSRPGTPSQMAMLSLPALNDMIDITTTRVGATQNHPPFIIFVLLGGLSLAGALLVGYAGAESANRPWLHSIMFAAILPLTIYVIVDLEFPRLGVIRIDAADQMLLGLPPR